MAHDEIAIVGVGCRFPGADDLDGYWRVLSKGENHVREIPRDRWDVETVYDRDPNAPRKTNVRQAGFVKDYHDWDHKLFGINEMEAGDVDPQQRMVLDCVHMALEDGGIRRQDIDGSYTGVYIGSMNDDFKTEAMASMDAVSAYTVTGLHSSIISARVAYVYNLHGPAVTMDTACSSSLVAINCAEQALKLGECDAAICGGANSILDAVQFVALSKARMLSPTGQSKPFSADADGYARGEGCGIVILKRLKDALRDGTTILATLNFSRKTIGHTHNLIDGVLQALRDVKKALRDGNKVWATLTTGCNQDGNTAKPMTAPSGSMQIDLLQRLYDRSKVDKHSVQVIEAHGTGTPIGDPIEANALGKFFGKPKGSKQKTPIGSVKSNIGHTEAAAGAAGLIKVLLMMKHGQVVPSLLLDKADINPKIDFNQFGFTLPTTMLSWSRPLLGQRIACVNSFGFGGTNSHAIVHEYVPRVATPKVKEMQRMRFPPLITLSALDEASLVDQVKEVTTTLKQRDYDMRSLSYTSTCRRDHRSFRKAFVANSQQDLISSCDKYIQTPTNQSPLSKPKVIFVFCGVGTTWQGMCNFMMKLDVFREAIQAIDNLLLPLSGWKLTSKLSSGGDVTTDPLVSHVAIFGCQVGLVEVWKSLGICPDLVVGQSVGEVAAAYTSGAIDLQSAVRVIYYRSKFLSEVREGAMAVVKNVDTAKIDEFCSTTNGKLSVAVYISPTSCTISGDKKSIDMVKEKLKNGLGAPGAMLIELDVTCAYHSPYVQAAAEKATQMLKILTPGKHVAPIISTVTGKEETHKTFTTASYWERNTRQPVRFGAAVLQAAEKSSSHTPVFLEIGPGPVLGAHVKNLFKNQAAQLVLPSVRKGSEAPTLCNTICTMYEIGLILKWERLVTRLDTVTDVPRYVFRQEKIPFKTKQVLTRTSTHTKEATGHMYVNDEAVSKNPFHIQVNETSTPFIFDHVVKGSVMIPGAFHADIGFKIAQTVLGISTDETIISLEFTSPARIEKGTDHRLTIEIDTTKAQEAQFFVKKETSLVCIGNVKSKTLADSHLQRDAVAGTHSTLSHCPTPDIEQLRLIMMTDAQINMDSTAIYETLMAMGFQYGYCFRILHECWAKHRQCLASFAIPDEVFRDIGNTVIHPCLLDGMFQSTFIATDEKSREIATEEKLALMPVAIQRLTVHGRPKTRTVYAYVTMTNSTILPTVLKLHYDIVLLNTDGTVIADVRNYTTYCRRGTAFTPDELRYRLSWSPVDVEQCAPSTPKTLFINAFHNHERSLPFTGENITVCDLNVSKLTEDTLQDSVLGAVKERWGGIEEVEVMAVFFGEEEQHSDIDHATAKQIFETAKQNCLVITWLLRFFMNRKQVPLFLLTENTQSTDNTKMRNVNLTGCEIWGFMRNVLIEFVHDKIVLVDLQPSLEGTLLKVFSMLSSALKNIDSTRTEYIIKADTVLIGTFSKTPVTDTMPHLRTSVCRPFTSKHMVMSGQENSIAGPFIAPLSDTDTLPRTEKGSVEIEIASVSIHDNAIFQTAASHESGSTNAGKPVVAMEYTGFEISSKVKGHPFRCQNNSVVAEEMISADRWQVAAVYPQQIYTRVAVPSGCTVNLKKLPFYKPNMLSYAILFWHMAKAVRKGATVSILSEPPDHQYTWLLERMLKHVVSATVVDQETSSSADTLVLVGRYDDTQFDLMNNKTTIVALKYAISNRVQKHLRNYRATTIAEIDTQVTFSKAEISRTLQKIVPWLKRYLVPSDNSSAMPDNQVVISNASSKSTLQLKLPLEDLFGTTTVFVITGGLTGLGWQTILMLLEKGVGVVATMSRREVDDETRKTIEDTEKEFGCKILCFRGDVCDLLAVTAMIEALTKEYGRGSIRGVIHGAGVLDSQLLANVDEEQLDRVMAPKVLGVMNLHIATKHLSLDFFITQSSISSIVGMPGQGNYGAANIFMDVFAHWRRSKSLAAQSINWGALEVGMAAQEQFKAKLVKRGYNLLSISQIRDCFVHIMMQNATGIVYANLDWSKIANHLSEPHMARVALSMKEVIKYKNLEHMKQFQTEDEEFSIVALRKLDGATRKREVERFVATVTRRTIGSDVETLTMESTFVELGLESLAAVTLSTVVYQETGYRISQETLFKKSLGDVAAEICTSIQ